MILVSLAASIVVSKATTNYSDYVDLFIGTEGTVPGTSYNGGNVFPGASMPFGAVKIGIDTTEFNSSTDANAGYTPDGNVTSISLLHESGTGGAPKYGVVSQMPLTTLQNVNLLDNMTYAQPRVGHDSAGVGWYSTKLASGVVIRMAACMHTGIVEYTFPDKGEKHVLVDVSHYLPTQDDHLASQFYSNGRVELTKEGYRGWGTWRGGWNQGPDYTVYFCAVFDQSATGRLFRGPYTDPYWANFTGASPTYVNGSSVQGGVAGSQFADRVGAIFEFPGNASMVKSKVGVSWISEDRACEFLGEIKSWDLNETITKTKEVWEDDVLSKIQVKGEKNTTRLTMFYTALYHTALLPSNRTGESPYWDDGGGYVDDIYTIWDTFRCWFSLTLLINRPIATDLVQTVISVWRHERFMPDGRSGNYNGRVQGGSNADNVLADAYVKHLPGINWTAAYQAALTDAEVVPYNNFDPTDLTGSTKEGRGALPDWLKYGFVTPAYARSVSRTVEYSLNDFAVAQLAAGLDRHPGVAQKYLERAAGWQRIWNRNVTSLGYSGFLAPTWPNGSVQANSPNGTYDPGTCGGCEWDAIAYEALPWEYSWTVPFDMRTLISLIGGANATEARLDTMFVPGLRTGTVGSGGINGIGTTLFNPGNEPSFATPFLYNYLPGRQWKSVLRSRQTVDLYYNTGPSGLPGNSDAGAVDSWLVWNMLGLYPVVTQPVYLILAPWFDDITMNIGDGKTIHITAKGLDVANGSIFVQSLKVNGVGWKKSWLTHDELVKGNATLEFVLGVNQTGWDIGDIPPSPGHVQLKL
ncbi:alpha-1,2-mannosidase family protein-like protein [Microthyrium microscopicum]|uniref:Alpha-1,2-mannosidase family protein-like protein n=1 Tax=Microthyrium microscopicum TaxID=703497 RepID=A0A6A6UD50_9PEZI|nr:alpha-1,2-mannosidase family protein-like protein [Microthyrium microscopicum]